MLVPSVPLLRLAAPQPPRGPERGGASVRTYDQRVIDRDTKRCLGQMMKGVQVVGAAHDGLVRAYCSHWVCQISFEEPILLASVSPRHDTHPLIAASGRFAVSVLAGDQVDVGQYFSYPGRKFRHLADEYLELVDGLPVVRNCISWMACDVIGRQHAVGGIGGFAETELDHELFFARVVAVGEGRLGEPPLLYSSRLGWRVTGEGAREPGVSIRDRLLERLAELGPIEGDDGAGAGGDDDSAPAVTTP
jgi:3-hydroxy-9,10-secoandrosta-1,3,5(10)-triene-9,17-dione monooxygenase reductase component